MKQYYGRDSQVIYPFCDFEVFQRPREVGDAYVIVTALVPYKRVDLAVETFNLSGKKLIIVGDGPELQRLKEMAKSNIQFLAPLSREDLAGLYSKGKALIFPGIEDFGIVPLESMAAGMPVIAYGVGGALETVTEKTGLFFTEPTVKSLTKAINQFESKVFDEEECRKRALLFSKKKFQTEVWSALEKNCPSKIWSSLGSAGIAPGSF